MTDREKFEAYFAPIAEGMKKCGVGAVGIARRKDNQWQGWQAALASQQPADDGWIDWTGGECPVNINSLVNVRYKNGGGDLESRRAEVYNWSHNDKECYPIIAYRVVKP